MASAAATAVDSDEYDDADLWETPLPVPRTALDTVHPPIDPDVLAAAVGAVPPPLYDANHVAAPFLAVLRDDMPHAEAAAHLVGDVEDYLQRWGLSLCTQIADLVYASDACDTLAPFMQELPRAMLWYLVAICDPFEQLGAALEDVCNVHDAKHRERGRCALCHRFWPRVLLTYEALRRGNNCVVRERDVAAYLGPSRALLPHHFGTEPLPVPDATWDAAAAALCRARTGMPLSVANAVLALLTDYLSL